MTRQPGPAEQLASGSAGLLVNRDDLDSAEDPVYPGVPCVATQDLGERRRRCDNCGVAAVSGLRIGVGGNVIGCQFAQSFSIENQSPVYSSS